MNKICLVTGGNRGIGLEIARLIGSKGHRIFLGARRLEDGRAAAADLRGEGIEVEAVEIDVSNEASVAKAARYVGERSDRLDVLVNNAGIMLDSVKRPDEVDIEDLRRTIETNVIGPFAVIKAFLPLLEKAEAANVVNMSSDLGSMFQASDPESRYDAVLGPSYRISKAALNMSSLVWAKRFRDTSIRVSTCSPGWCRTGLDAAIDSSKAPNSAADGADTAVWLALEADDSQRGRFFAKRQEIAW